jgi:hypothetical protein
MSNDGNLPLKIKETIIYLLLEADRDKALHHLPVYNLEMSLHLGEIFLTRYGRIIYRGRNRLNGCRTVSRWNRGF